MHELSIAVNLAELVAFVSAESADAVLAAMRETPEGRDAVRIGTAVVDHAGMTLVRTEVGGSRVLDLPYHEQLPRIC